MLTSNADEGWLVLSTIHSAKGLEWDAVCLIHAADGCLPSDMSAGTAEDIEEELRLLYVALTRAKDFLYVFWPFRYYHKGRGLSDAHGYAQRSRFLTDAVISSMELPRQTPANVPELLAPPQVADISRRIADMWR